MKWLNAFAIVNDVAAQKIINKFSKRMIHLGDNNILHFNLLQILEMTEFKRNRFIGKLSKDIIEFYASYLTKGNKKLAENMLNK